MTSRHSMKGVSACSLAPPHHDMPALKHAAVRLEPERSSHGRRLPLLSLRGLQRGFTLIEIVITLSLIALLITMGLLSTQNLSHIRALHEPMAKLREFAKKARNLAILEQRPYQVEILPQSVAIYSMVSEGAEAGGFGAAAAAQPQGRVDSFSWSNDVGMSTRRWRAKEFAPPGRQVWIFERSGLCEPITVRAQSEHGFVEMAFNPLDAHVEDETSEIY